MRYSIRADFNVDMSTYNDIINLYDYLENIRVRSSINTLPYKIEASVFIGDLKASDLKKEEFIEEAVEASAIKLYDISLCIKSKDLQQTVIMLYVSYPARKQISIMSDNKLLIDEFMRLIKDDKAIERQTGDNNQPFSNSILKNVSYN